jgi:hypothetical protein
VLETEEVEVLLAVRLKSAHSSVMFSTDMGRGRHITSSIETVPLVVSNHVSIFRVSDQVTMMRIVPHIGSGRV